MITLGLIGIIVAGLLTYIGFNAPNSIPGRGYYNLKAQFDDADNIAPHGQVRIGGKIVGQVLRPRIEDGLAVVDLQIDPEYEPLRSDTVVEVRPRSAVGVRYVDIKAGESGRPLGEGEMIPAAQTKATRPLDEVLGTFDPETRVRTQMFLREFGTGLAGRGEDLNDTIREAPDTLRGVDSVLGEIADRDDAAGNLVRGGATAATAADPVREQIRDGFEPEARALRPFSDEGDALRSTLDKAPPALNTLSGRLPAVEGLATELEGFAARVRPVLKASPGAFRQTSALLREARPGLRDANRTLRLANTAVNPTLALLDTVRPVLPIIESTLDNSKPLVERLGLYGCDIINFGRRWGEMQGFGNAAGGVLRFNVVTPGADALVGIGEGAGLNQVGVNRSSYPPPCTAGTEKVKPFTLTPAKAGR
jgi:ABC-type transporter Mla subunit MlaD